MPHAVPRTAAPRLPASSLGPYRWRDYAAQPDQPRCELLYGHLLMSPSPSPLHQLIVALLAERLRNGVRASGGLVLFAPLDLHLADHSVVQPDLVVYRAARRPALDARLTTAPDLAIEVLSPGSARHDRGTKLALYAEAGIPHYWLFDPHARDAQFLVLGADGYRVALPGPDGRYRAADLATIDVDAFWRLVSDEADGIAPRSGD
ncbi:MAG: Uma2 family endonuclease [Acidobacteriota bacterium]